MEEYQYTTEAIDKYYSGEDQWKVISNHNITPEESESALGQLQNVNIVKSANGKVVSYNFQAKENVTPDIEESINSNASPNIKSFEIPSNSGIETVTSETGETVKQMTFKSGMKQAGNFVFGEVMPAVCAVSTGITLGKTIDRLLYNANPDFWDERGMSTLNPDTWDSITSNDTFGGRVFNYVFGLNPDDNSTQAYMDENALAYLTAYLNNIGAFTQEKTTIESSDITELNNYVYYPLHLASSPFYTLEGTYKAIIISSVPFVVFENYSTPRHLIAIFASSTPVSNAFGWTVSQNPTIPSLNEDVTREYTYNGKTVYWSAFGPGTSSSKANQLVNKLKQPISVNTGDERMMIAWSLIYGNLQTTGGIEGIGTQPDAKLPDLSDSTDINSTLQALKNQYPELWENAVDQDVAQPDGSTKTYTYVPVAMPEIDPEGNPVSSSSTQKKPQIDPAEDPEPLLDLISKIIQRDPPVNPPDIGSGITPIVPSSSGSASALYMIYNPTLAQINSFGAWLWSDNFVDQIKKLFNDPMQAIIGLHKVYATPATGGAQTIKVGYLDSGVSARVVSNQYTTIDCGTVRLSEQFHNVFDYSPYTEVNLYLPFIGIVNINVSDVMRSSIHIVYHVDVLSGACLAEVKVTRDSAGGTLYQYAGNASVTLPISSGSYMGIVSAVAGVAGGIAGTIASGGAALPLLASSAGAMFNAHTRVEHSGGFSGNAGAMGGKIPYLIISRPQTEMADGFENYIGYPSNFTATIGSCTGFIKVIECHVENTNATNSELTEISTMLQEGVIV